MYKFIVLLNLLYATTSPAISYPAKWWKPFPRKDAPKWEILPQDAKRGEVILSKRTELGILSNFAATPFVIDGKKYKSLEGFWQMMKFPEGQNDPRIQPGLKWHFKRYQVAQMVGIQAKRAGRIASKNMEKLGINWVTYYGKKMSYRVQLFGDHYRLIERAMRAKAYQNPRVRNLLLRTGDLILRPDHFQGKAPPPAWQYHKIWMKIRDQLRTRYMQVR